MAKDFDKERNESSRSREDRTFILGGETFVLRKRVRPEALAAFDDLEELGESASLSDSLRIIDDLILTLMETADDAHVRFRRIREEEGDEALGVDDLRAVVDWMMEAVTGRPTGSPSDSSDGRKRIETPLTEGSSSPVTPEALTV